MNICVVALLFIVCNVYVAVSMPNNDDEWYKKRDRSSEEDSSQSRDSSSEEDSRKRYVYRPGNVAELQCQEKEVIQITEAVYRKPGRKGCKDPSARNKVVNECNGKKSCTFTVAVVDDPTSEGEIIFDCSASGAKLSLRYECIFDPCSTHCCANEGECELADPDIEDFTPVCKCRAHWKGDRCDANPCEEFVCSNGGICTIMTDGTANCLCAAGFTGPNCETELCNPSPCQNGGICVLDKDSGNARCDCPAGFTGNNCETNVCSPSSCQNGGICVLDKDSGNARCYCPAGFTGNNCETNVCSSSPCQNGGICVLDKDSGNGRCYCPAGYTGNNCENGPVCQQKLDQGPCSNFLIKYFYNATASQCVPFWYGGCQGNQNNFDSKEDCKAACVKVNCSDIATTCPSELSDLNYDGSCYLIPTSSDVVVNWHTAQEKCEDIGANLWQPNNYGEYSEVDLNVFASSDLGISYWTGINDISDEGAPVAVGSGMSVNPNLTPLVSANTNSNNDDKDCVFLQRSRFEYGVCNQERPFICEKRKNPCEN